MAFKATGPKTGSKVTGGKVSPARAEALHAAYGRRTGGVRAARLAKQCITKKDMAFVKAMNTEWSGTLSEPFSKGRTIAFVAEP